MESKVTSHITKGLIISLILIVLGLVAQFSKFQYETWYRWVPTIVLCVAIIWACISYANQKNNAVTYGNVFAHGFKTTAVVAIITMIFALISIFVIFPNMKEEAIDMARREMEKNPQLSEDQVDQAIEMTRKFFLVGVIGATLLGTLIAGTIAALLGAAFAKKNPPSPFQQQS